MNQSINQYISRSLVGPRASFRRSRYLVVSCCDMFQLYVPVSNALGLGACFRELEELAYKSLFPETYSETARWHHDVRSNPLRGWTVMLWKVSMSSFAYFSSSSDYPWMTRHMDPIRSVYRLG